MNSRVRLLLTFAAILMALRFVAVPAYAKEAGGDNSAGELAKKTQNPVADMISLPLQYNTYLNTGPDGNRTQEVLLVQPVVPFHLNETWNFIARPIIPVINQPAFSPAQDREYGIGNIQFQGFFSPRDTVGGWVLGIGPYLEFPTNSSPDNRFGSDNSSAGPAFLALQMKGKWVYGSLVTHLWSYAGNEAEVNSTVVQPFVNYNMADGWYLSSGPSISVNWSAADSDDRVTLPLGGGVGRVFRIGKQPINAFARVYNNVIAPRSAADWQLQFQLQFLFPK
jgi:hypothetical protein